MREIFIRDDDVYKYDRVFLEVFNFLKKNGIGAIYAVVPGLIDNKTVRLLNKEKNKDPSLFNIVQHGWQHKNYSKSLSCKYEFGALRSYSQQKKDILAGYKVMLDIFGKNFTPAFVPPYHGYDRNTLTIIKELKIPLFSSGDIAKITRKEFLDLPAQMPLNDYARYGKPVTTDAKTMIKRFLVYLGRNTDQYLGMVFHHNAVANQGQLNELKTFFLFLNKLEKERLIRIKTFSQLFAGKKALFP